MSADCIGASNRCSSSRAVYCNNGSRCQQLLYTRRGKGTTIYPAPHAGVASNADKCPDVERISESAAVAIADEAAADVAVTAAAAGAAAAAVVAADAAAAGATAVAAADVAAADTAALQLLIAAMHSCGEATL